MIDCSMLRKQESSGEVHRDHQQGDSGADTTDLRLCNLPASVGYPVYV